SGESRAARLRAPLARGSDGDRSRRAAGAWPHPAGRSARRREGHRVGGEVVFGFRLSALGSWLVWLSAPEAFGSRLLDHFDQFYCVGSLARCCAALRRSVTIRVPDAGWSSPVARWAHNPKVAGSNPAPATI